MLFVNSSINNLFLSLHKAYTEPDNDAALSYLKFELENLFIDQRESEMPLYESCFGTDLAAITQHIVNTVKDVDDAYACNILYCYAPFSIFQPASATAHLAVRNLNTNDQQFIPNTTFPQLKNRLLKQYIREQQSLQLGPVDLSMFDFEALECEAWDKRLAELLIGAGADFKSVLTTYLASKPCLGSHLHKATLLKQYLETERGRSRLPIDLSEFNLDDVNFSGMDFTGAVIGQRQLDAMINGSGNLSGALLAEKVNASTLHCLDKVTIDKTMAIQLIAAGANPRTVLIHYLATERSLKHIDIDISGINLSQVDPLSMDLYDVNLNGIQFVKAPLCDKEKLHANFEHDLLAMLTMYSQTVFEVISRSSTREYENNSDAEKIDPLLLPLEYVRQNNHYDEVIKAAIKTSTGNCREMALMCKNVTDFYLKESLKTLGYQDVAFKTSCIVARQPEDHALVLLRCIFQGVQRSFLIDPWTGGKAWAYLDGLHYLRTNTPDRESSKSTSFVENENYNAALDNRQLQSSIRAVFDQFNIKQQLDLTIRKNKARFLGIGSNLI